MLVSSILDGPLSLSAALELDATAPVSLSIHPFPWAPLKWSNASLVRPAEHRLSFADAHHRIRTSSQSASNGEHAYLRHAALDTLPNFTAALPITRALSLAGPRLQQANLWLGDGRLRSSIHFDDRDNLILQLEGTKEVLLIPPALLGELGYATREERRFVLDATHRLLTSTEPTGRSPVENHSPLQPFVATPHDGPPLHGLPPEDLVPNEAALLTRISAEASLCTLPAGDALFVPALWSHALFSRTDIAPPTGTRAPHGMRSQARVRHGRHGGVNAMINLWYVRGLASFEHAVAVAPSFAAAHLCHGSAMMALGDRPEQAVGAFERARACRTAPDYEATRQLGLALLASSSVRSSSTRLHTTPPAAADDERRSELRRATALLKQAASMRPADLSAQQDYAHALTSVGAQHAHARRFGDASRCFERALNITPSDGGLYRQLANALHDLGGKRAKRRALEALEAAVQLNPADSAAVSELTSARLRRAVAHAGGWSRELERKVRTEVRADGAAWGVSS